MDSTPYWFLGLPFDCVSEDVAAGRVLHAINSGTPLSFATPNVNFVTLASKDPEFQTSILGADLSLVDGMPLVWLGRACGIPFPERVAGSSLFERLQRTENSRRIRVFFFGGDEGVAEAASEGLLREGGTLEPVGGMFPGFSSIDDMSDDDTIQRINAARADFLVVALGARKGHLWITRNRPRLNAPVVSHLGAVVNFVAGRLRRAPKLLQRAGLEWAWRTISEPSLASRYAADAMRLARDLPSPILPSILAVRARRQRRSLHFRMLEADATGSTAVLLENDFTAADVPQYLAAIARLHSGGTGALQIDLSRLQTIDCHALGALYATKWRTTGCRPVITAARDAPIYRQFVLHRAQTLIDPRPVN